MSPTLLKKYNVPGPRYTSYPTVPYWSDTPSESQWISSIQSALTEAESTRTGAAIYIHVPFCESLCTYCGCNTRITRNHAVAHPYIQTVLKEWELYLEKLGRESVLISELHLGGGTPTFLTPDELKTLLSGLLKRTTRTKDFEFSVEADPRVTTREHLDVMRTFGFERLSLGIQDFDPHVQQIVHREQSPEQVNAICNVARELGYSSINFDLIYGLPFQTLDSVKQTLSIVNEIKPDRIAFYAYAHVPWIKPSQRRFTEADLPSGEDKRALYEIGREILEKNGYVEIGMDHFALKTDSLWKAAFETQALHRNFMGYTSRYVAPQFGLGVSAIGDSWNAFMQNEKNLEIYQERIAKGELPIHRGHLLSKEDSVIRKHILNIMTKFETNWSTEDLYTEYLEHVSDRLQEFLKDDLIVLDRHHLKVNPAGHAFLRNICMAFDARLTRQAPQTKLFSQTI